MVVRVDRTNLQRGRDSAIAIYSTDLEMMDVISLSVFDVVKNEVIDIDCMINNSGAIKKVYFTTPKVDGFLFANVKGSKVIKKIGTPPFTFCLAFTKGFALKYDLHKDNGQLLRSGFLKEVVDGFYFTPLESEVSYIKVLNKIFTVKEEFDSLGYDVTMSDANLQDIELGEVALTQSLPDINLDEIDAGDYEIEDIAIDAQIKEI